MATERKLAGDDGDQLAQLARREIARRRQFSSPPRALDLPCADGRYAVALARAGAQVIAVDLPTHRQAVEGRATAADVIDRVQFVAGSLHALQQLPRHSYDVIFCRRGLHHLPFEEARTTVRELLQLLRIGGKLYVSAFGLYSPLGDHYPAAELPIEERYAELPATLARQYDLHGPVCLYTERNLFLILVESGGSVLQTFSTTLGTVKGIAVRV
jgi:SAM-dependent methyltransferase